ncbi:MAG: hypothetical protein LUQ33_02725 [Methanoregulaceae archaeon]|nr:hypothetical protein [Methanoregulaceae archaeon]
MLVHPRDNQDLLATTGWKSGNWKDSYYRLFTIIPYVTGSLRRRFMMDPFSDSSIIRSVTLS